MNLEHFQPDFGPGRGPALGDIFADVNSGDVENAFLHHGLHIGVGNIVAVLDRIHACFYRVVNTIKRHGV